MQAKAYLEQTLLMTGIRAMWKTDESESEKLKVQITHS